MKQTSLYFSGLLCIGLLFSGGCQKEPIPSISADKSLAEIGETISFTNSTIDADHFSWDFGDGSTSTEVNPTHSYSTAADYTVTMTAFSKNGKKKGSQELILRITDYAYKFNGIYTGITIYQSSYCGSGTSSNNLQIAANITGNTMNILNLDNKFTQFTTTITGSGNNFNILPQTGVFANDGHEWDIDTIHVSLSGNILLVTYQMTDLPYSGTCGNYGATIECQK